MTTLLADITPKQAIRRFQDQLGLSETDLTAGLGVSARTLSRWRQGVAYPQHDARQRMNDLLALSDALADTFDSPNAIRAWMHAESRYLGGLTPAEAVRAGRIDRARLALQALEAGVYL
jgi:transcriptional regulator with XRE-family HTH domain